MERVRGISQMQSLRFLLEFGGGEVSLFLAVAPLIPDIVCNTSLFIREAWGLGKREGLCRVSLE